MDRTSQINQKGLAGFLWPGMEEKVSETLKSRNCILVVSGSPASFIACASQVSSAPSILCQFRSRMSLFFFSFFKEIDIFEEGKWSSLSKRSVYMRGR